MSGDRPEPFDDPGFVAGLSSLDPDRQVRPPGDPYAPAAPPGPPGGAPGRRPLLDLFPPGGAPLPVFDQLPPGPATNLPPAETFPPAIAPPGAVPLPPAPIPPPLVRPRSAGPPSTLPPAVSFYGLDEAAFSPATDARFLYESEAYGRAAQQILAAIWRHEKIVVLTGEPGIGKTMLCRSVIEQLDRRTLVSMVTDPFVSIDDLLRTVLLDLGVISASELAAGQLARASRAELLGALRDFLVSIAPLQAFAVVIIDDAEQLPPDALLEVAGLGDLTGDDQLLQVMLVGRLQLLETLDRRELRPLAERVAVQCRLGPLASEEIPWYVAQRLATAGASSLLEFNHRAIARVYEISRGVPRVVNQLCDQALRAGVDPGAGVIDALTIDAAARDLDIEEPLSAPKALARRAAMALVLTLLALAGAAGGALVFRAEVGAFLSEWQNTPAVPTAPAPAIPPLLAPVPPPPTGSEP